MSNPKASRCEGLAEPLGSESGRWGVKEKPCNKCVGTTQLTGGFPCWSCGGTGKVKVSIFIPNDQISVTVAHAAAAKALADSAEALVAAFAAQEEPEKK